MHILLWFLNSINPDDIDQLISAEIPDVNDDSELHGLVMKHMIHGPCGIHNEKSPCMHEKKCKKNFPKAFNNYTQVNQDGYPLYKRRSKINGGFCGYIKMKTAKETEDFEVENKLLYLQTNFECLTFYGFFCRWVVPYNGFLLKIFKSHINVEWCKSVSSIKYILKGPDYASFAVTKNDAIIDEVKNYQTGRYINSNEAAWKIFGFETHGRYPPVQHLDVHLENYERVYFEEKNASNVLKEQKRTTLTAFFELCKTDEFAKTLLYSDVSRFYTYDKQKRQFKKRVQGKLFDVEHNIKEANHLSRIYTVNPRNRECYYLRLLLNKIKGPKSFLDLKTVDNIVYSNYQETCLKLGLIGDDKEWEYALEEAIMCDSPYKIRNLFAVLLTFCEVSNPENLWKNFWKSMSEYIEYNLTRSEKSSELMKDDYIHNVIYSEVNKILFKISGNKLDYYFIKPPTNYIEYECLSFFNEENSYNLNEETEFVINNSKTLNEEQRKIHTQICNKFSQNETGIIFIDAPGGTGKTYLLNLILAKVRSEKKIALAVASSGTFITLAFPFLF